MSLTNSNEKTQLFNKVSEIKKKENVTTCLTQPDDKVDSYYIARDIELNGMREYSIPSIKALRKELQDLWCDEPDLYCIIPLIIAAAFKQKQVFHTDEVYEEELPSFIYNF